MISKNIIISACLATIGFTVTGCLEDIVPPPLTGELDKTAKMLMVFEQDGDFINTYMAPPLVTAQDLHDNIADYIIIDVREQSLFNAGHIANALNISHYELFDFIKNQRDSISKSVVLVSKNGQSSAFYATLLILAGFDNIYTLKYGMASWHIDFAQEWFDALGDSPIQMTYTNDVFPKNEFTDFPFLEEFNSDMSIPEIIESRIRMLIYRGFYTNDTHLRNMISADEGNYLVCYGSSGLYLGPKINGVGFGHPVGTVSYRDDPWYELRTYKDLQTMPPDKSIIIYSYNGQLSACVVAYLQILGYRAKSLLFGANQLFYSRMLNQAAINEYAFTTAEIMNYEYVTGE